MTFFDLSNNIHYHLLNGKFPEREKKKNMYRCLIIKHRRIIKHRQRSRGFINSYNSLNNTLNDMHIYVVLEYMHIRITREY